MPTLILRILIAFLLLFNSIGAFYGGWSFITHPDGSGLGMNLTFLEASPFDDYLIPGIVLISVNGVFCLVVLILHLLKYRGHEWFVMAQGALLLGWILIQVVMIREVIALHWIMGSVGLALLICGRVLQKWNLRKKHL